MLRGYVKASPWVLGFEGGRRFMRCVTRFMEVYEVRDSVYGVRWNAVVFAWLVEELVEVKEATVGW